MVRDATGILAAATLAVTLLPGASFHVHGRDIHLADVALVTTGQFAGGNPIVARLPAGLNHLVLTGAQLGDLIRRAIPDAQVMGATQEPVVLTGSRAAAKGTGPCFTLAVHKSAGAIISRDTVEPAACLSGQTPAQVRLDPDLGMPVATVELEAGAYLGQLFVPSAPAVRRGQKIVIRGAAGPVRVQRTVVALQSASSTTRRVFVRDSDGGVFATELSTDTGQ